MTRLNDIVENYRKNKGLTQEDLTYKLGVSKSTYNNVIHLNFASTDTFTAIQGLDGIIVPSDCFFYSTLSEAKAAKELGSNQPVSDAKNAQFKDELEIVNGYSANLHTNKIFVKALRNMLESEDRSSYQYALGAFVSHFRYVKHSCHMFELILVMKTMLNKSQILADRVLLYKLSASMLQKLRELQKQRSCGDIDKIISLFEETLTSDDLSNAFDAYKYASNYLVLNWQLVDTYDCAYLIGEYLSAALMFYPELEDRRDLFRLAIGSFMVDYSPF